MDLTCLFGEYIPAALGSASDWMSVSFPELFSPTHHVTPNPPRHRRAPRCSPIRRSRLSLRGGSGAKPLAHSHGVYLGTVPAEAARVAVLLTAQAYIAEQRARHRTSRETTGLLLLDDARVVLKSIGRMGQAAVEPFQHVLDTAQSAGLGVIACVQSSTELGETLLTNADTLILVGPQDGHDLLSLQPRLQLSSDQRETLLHQKPGHAVIHSRSHAYSHPFPLTLAPPDLLPSASDALARQQTGRAALLGGHVVDLWRPSASVADPPTPAAPRAPEAVQAESTAPKSPQRGPEPLNPDAHRLLLSVLQSPHLLQTEHGKACGIQGRELTALRDELVSRGLLRVNRCLRYTLLEATREGAAHMGIEHKPLAGVGTFPHRFLQERLRYTLAQTHPRVVVEHTERDARYDVYAETREGERLAVEIVLDVSTLERALEKLRRFNGAGRLIVPDAGTAARTRKSALFIASLAVEPLSAVFNGKVSHEWLRGSCQPTSGADAI